MCTGISSIEQRSLSGERNSLVMLDHRYRRNWKLVDGVPLGNATFVKSGRIQSKRGGGQHSNGARITVAILPRNC